MLTGRTNYESSTNPGAGTLNANERALQLSVENIDDNNLASSLTLDVSQVQGALPSAGGVLSGNLEMEDAGGVPTLIDSTDVSEVKETVEDLSANMPALQVTSFEVTLEATGATPTWTMTVSPSDSSVGSSAGLSLSLTAPEGYDSGLSGVLPGFSGYIATASPITVGDCYPTVSRTNDGFKVDFTVDGGATGDKFYYYVTAVWVRRGL